MSSSFFKSRGGQPAATAFIFHDRDKSHRLAVFLSIVESPCVHMPSPLQHSQWHMAAQWPQALAFQLSPELVQWMGWGGVRIRGLGG